MRVLAVDASASAQVQTVGDVSFAVPDGWNYKQGADLGAMALKADSRFWVVAVYSAMPSSGDPNADFRAAWKRVVLAGPDYRGVPNYDPYNITESVGSGRLKHVNRYRFANLQQALDGSTVLTLWPPVDMAKIHPNRDSEYWTRPGKK